MLTELNEVSMISTSDETSTKQIVDEFVLELYSDEPKKTKNWLSVNGLQNRWFRANTTFDCKDDLQ